MKQRHNRIEMQALFEMREREGLTLLQLSRRTGIPVPTLSYWSSKFRKERAAGEPAATSLVPVRLIGDSIPGATRIEIGSSIRIHVEPGFDAAHLCRLLQVAASAC